MAILTGFPPSNTISPSVRIAEKDNSFVAPEQSFHRSGIVGFASKGPINIPTVIRSRRQLNTVFGFPHPDAGDPYLIYAAEQYLLVANELFVVRVGDNDVVSDTAATTAEVDIPAAGGQILISSDTAGPYVFTGDHFFRWKLNGITASKTLVVLDGTYTTDELVEALNDQLNDEFDGIEFSATDADELAVSALFSYGPDSSLELLSVQDAIYGGASSITGLGQNMTQAVTTGAADRYPVDGYNAAGSWDFSGVDAAEMTINIVVDGADNVLIDNVVQTIDLSDLAGTETDTATLETAIQTAIADLPGGFEGNFVGDNLVFNTLHHGADARILVKSDSGLFAAFDFDGLTGVGVTPEGVTGDADIHTLGLVVGAEDSDTTTFTITADSPGIDGNYTQVRIVNDPREAVFNIEVYNNGVQVESWGNLTKNSASTKYVETYLALVSNWIRATDNTDTSAPPLGLSDGTSIYDLAGGADGIPADPDDQDTLLLGSELGFTGIYAMSEPEQIDIDLIACPGHASTAIVNGLIDLCQNKRKDCLALIDPPFGLTVSEIVQWQNGSHPLNTTRFDSDFAALYWPWVKIRDNYNQVDVWVPPSGSVMAVYARSDQIGEPWYAPAGTTRGVVPGITDVFSRPTRDERDLMYGNRNAVNPIIQFADSEDFVVWGQKTLQRTPTALDRVSVRRTMFVIQKRLAAACRSLLFEPHDEVFRSRFIEIATSILREVQIGRGLTDFIIQADDELNTPDTIDRGEFRARIGVQPVHAVEFIFIEFSIHRTGSFTDNAATF